ncbi:hypothetical protein JCM19240_5475 [Vibrio maritimus]|uniref:Uncharacterized protein n=1 Tax=Vibrio maritimus TaxID=990268 RepID=A0A090T024_9VIBR|nr:hypothetical protein JCM19240_5475 [Vibrio maritimus]
MQTFRHTTFRVLLLLTALLVVALCALKTNVAYHSNLQAAPSTSMSTLNLKALLDSESLNNIVHDSASAAEPCFVTKKLLTQSLPSIEDLTPFLFLIALIAIVSTRLSQHKHFKRSGETPAKYRLHLTLCTFRE